MTARLAGVFWLVVSVGVAQPRSAAVLDPSRTVPNNAARPPVVMLNGYQIGCVPSTSSPRSASTFGEMEAALLRAGVPVVYFFDNCVQGLGAKIEDLGDTLGQFLDLIKFDNGNPVPQVDLVVHSMGGLIARAYLAGMKSNGTFAPLRNSRVRKMIQIATPNFGSYFAENAARTAAFSSFITEQVRQMLPGSPFLWNLATWNQGGDDLRGVDALAIIGNRGPVAPLNSAGDGVVSLTSGSLGFARDPSRTRIVPYCHIDQNFFVSCGGSGIAKADDVISMVTSFLLDTAAWQAGGSAVQDPLLSLFGGVYYAQQTATGQFVTDFPSAAFGSTTLQGGGAPRFTFYSEFNRGTDSFAATSPTAGQFTCGPFAQPLGYFAAVRCKVAATIYSVTPAFPGTSARVVLSGGRINLNGAGFGADRCGACRVTINGAALQVISWSDSVVSVQLPPVEGFQQIVVEAASSTDKINIMAAVPTLQIVAVTNGASFQPGFAPNGWVTITGTLLSRTTRVWSAADIIDGNLPISLDGVSVKINGAPAYIYYVSPTQLNVLAPTGISDTTASEDVAIEVTAPDGTVRATALKRRYAPAIFLLPGGIAAAVNADGSVATSSTAIPGLFAHAAKPGDTIQLYTTGLGSGTNPAVPPGRIVDPPAALTDTVSVLVGGQPANVTFAGLVSPGLYQVNFVVPQLAAGNHAVSLTIAGTAGQNTGTIAVEQ